MVSLASSAEPAGLSASSHSLPARLICRPSAAGSSCDRKYTGRRRRWIAAARVRQRARFSYPVRGVASTRIRMGSRFMLGSCGKDRGVVVGRCWAHALPGPGASQGRGVLALPCRDLLAGLAWTELSVELPRRHQVAREIDLDTAVVVTEVEREGPLAVRLAQHVGDVALNAVLPALAAQRVEELGAAVGAEADAAGELAEHQPALEERLRH